MNDDGQRSDVDDSAFQMMDDVERNDWAEMCDAKEQEDLSLPPDATKEQITAEITKFCVRLLDKKIRCGSFHLIRRRLCVY